MLMSDIVSLFFLQHLVHVHRTEKHIQFKGRPTEQVWNASPPEPAYPGALESGAASYDLDGHGVGGTAHGIRFQIKNLYNC